MALLHITSPLFTCMSFIHSSCIIVLKRSSNPKKSLSGLAKYVLISGQVVDTSSPAGENSSYNLKFAGPQLLCSENMVDISKVANFRPDTSPLPFRISWEVSVPYRERNFVHRSLNLSIIYFRTLWWYPDTDSVPWESNSTVTYMGSQNVLNCQPVSTIYDLTFTYNKTGRYITYTKHDSRLFQPDLGLDLPYPWLDSDGNFVPDPPVNGPEMKVLGNKLKDSLDNWNMWALLDAAVQSMEYNCHHQGHDSHSNTTLPNGSVVWAGFWEFQQCRTPG